MNKKREGRKIDFISIDFEIANKNLNSACSLGLVFVKNNTIIDQQYFLIKPPVLDLDEEFTKIHGITANELENAPSFAEVWDRISHYFHQGNLIIAHNARFDMSILKNCLMAYSLKEPEFQYVCSIPISTRACRGEGIGKSLAARTNRFGIVIDHHHNALSDARAVAELVIKCVQIKSRKSIQSYINTYSSIPVKSFAELKPQTIFGKKRRKFNRVSINDIKPINHEFNENHPFFRKNLVFTGELQSIDRKEAMQKAVNVGALVKSGVSKKTDYLIVGEQDKSLVGKDGLSTKEKKAFYLIEEGESIKIIDEGQFLKLLESLVTN
ncbi:exonuclease domain-containing protein [Bacillus aquiflavi]|uniref:exonuclease domain-containing protein n=1 Tax=Bacillus aquiflavi TaxID=2672567 RepID=UPI001C554C5D|nr:exonuclease domain-containing protein [Bacillus aquiflavi]